MKNKTCGECKHFNTQKDKCLYNGRFSMSKSYFDACIYFEQKSITNGDKLRQMSDEELVGFVSCSACIYAYQDCADKTCTEGRLAWLNAPAESGGNK